MAADAEQQLIRQVGPKIADIWRAQVARGPMIAVLGAPVTPVCGGASEFIPEVGGIYSAHRPGGARLCSPNPG